MAWHEHEHEHERLSQLPLITSFNPNISQSLELKVNPNFGELRDLRAESLDWE